MKLDLPENLSCVQERWLRIFSRSGEGSLPVRVFPCADKESSGFTLLEVMVAMAVLGIALLALLTLHHQSLQSVIHSRDISRAAMLSQAIMSQAELMQFPNLGVTKGNFEQLFPGEYKTFRWERRVEGSGIFPDVRRVRVVIYYGPKFGKRFTIVEYMHNPMPPDQP